MPLIEVSGRTFPVEGRYRPLAAEPAADADEDDPGERQTQDRDQTTGITDAVM